VSRHRFTIELTAPDADLQEEVRIHARGKAPLPEHPSEYRWKDLSWVADRPYASVEITDYTQIGPPDERADFQEGGV
jgi:hypothetical protein